MARSLARGDALSCPDGATGRDAAAGGSQRLPARTGGQDRGRPRPPADLVRPARSRAAHARPARRARSRPGLARRRRGGRGLAPPAPGRSRGRACGLAVHRSSDPGHWIITFPWLGAERALTIAEAALALAERDVSPSRTARLTGAQERRLRRWGERIDEARATPPTWVRDADRRMPVVSISGTNGKSTVTRLITHIAIGAGRHVGTTTSDGVLVDERMVDPGDWTGSGGAHQILSRSDVDLAVLETARGGMVLRGVGYESNDASVLTNVSSDHLDLQGIHTLPELAEVKSVICRITKPDGWVVLNADDPHVAATARRVRGQVALFTMLGDASRAVRRHRAGGGRAYLARDGWLIEANGAAETKIVELVRVPIAIGGLARHNVANALAAAGGARGLGMTIAHVRDGLVDFAPSSERSPGRLNLYRLGSKVVIVDFAHNEAGDLSSPRRGGGDRWWCCGSRGTDHGDHRDRGRPAGRHPSRHRQDRRTTNATRRDQGDAQLPARTERGLRGWRVDGGHRRRRQVDRRRTGLRFPRRRRFGPS